MDAGKAYGFKMDVNLRIQAEAVAEKQGAWCCDCCGLSGRSACSGLRAEDPVARVAQARHDVAVSVELPVDGGDVRQADRCQQHLADTWFF